MSIRENMVRERGDFLNVVKNPGHKVVTEDDLDNVDVGVTVTKSSEEPVPNCTEVNKTVPFCL